MSITIKKNIKPTFEIIDMLCDKPLSKDLNKVNSASRNMLNGTSSQNAAININLTIGSTAVNANSKNVYLVLNYDCIFILDPRTKMITLNQKINKNILLYIK